MKRIFAMATLVFCLFFFMPSFVASAEDLTFTLNTNGYTSGTWSAQDVVVQMVYNGQASVEYEMSIGNTNNWQNFSGTHTFNQNFNSPVWFRLVTDTPSYSLLQMLEIKVDKVSPQVDFVLTSNVLPTNQNVVLTLIATDDYSGVNQYKLGNGPWQNENVFTIVSNVSYLANQVAVRDKAGNVGYYHQDVVINNIDKRNPTFTLIASTTQSVASSVINIQVDTIASGLAQVLIETPSGQKQDITQSYQNGFLATENGEYRVTVTSVAGNSTSMVLVIGNLTGVLAVWQRILILFVLFVLGTVAGVYATNLTRKRIKNKKRMVRTK